jgi:hypothetical protein
MNRFNFGLGFFLEQTSQNEINSYLKKITIATFYGFPFFFSLSLSLMFYKEFFLTS